jgi:hypothetical protein
MAIVLLPGERVLRSDLVQLQAVPASEHLSLGFEIGRVAQMTITTMRIAIEPPVTPALVDLRILLHRIAKVPAEWACLPLRQSFLVDLSQVTGFQTWRPEFSGAILILMGDNRFADAYRIQLLSSSSTVIRQRLADEEEEANHFRDMELAWRAAKALTG